MKYKVVGIILCICMLAASFTVYAGMNPKKHRYQQHIDAPEKLECTNHSDDKFCTHLPLVEIDTDGLEIPGKAVLDEHGELQGYTTTNGLDRIEASIKVIDNEETNNHIDDEPAVESKMIIHVRGNSSRTFDKSGYAIRLITEDGENNPQSIMGMDAHHEWVLHGPILDKTLMRNYMWYNIAGQMMEYAPNVRFCEVILNGEYNGVYVMLENITAGDNGARLQLSVDKKQNTYSGYLLQLDRELDESEIRSDSFTKYALRRTAFDLQIMYPGKNNLTPELNRSITQDFSDFEKAIYSYDFDNDEFGYKDLIDVDSFVDYFILNEFTCNYDAGWLSTYIYKDIDMKYKMCIWDFNSACDAYQESYMYDVEFQFQNCLWYVMLMKDEDFNNRIIERYRELRKGVLSEEYLDNYIDDVIEYLGPAIDRNYEKWGYSFEHEHDMLVPIERNPRSYVEAVENMKAFIAERGKNMDENIETILQYSADSKMKKFMEDAN